MASDVPLTEIIAKGRWGTVECAVRASGETPARDFLETVCEGVREKGKDKPRATAHARFLVLFQQMANYGQLSHQRFKKEMGKLSAFRHEVRNKQIRFPCFQDGTRWILTHGFIKGRAEKRRANIGEELRRPILRIPLRGVNRRKWAPRAEAIDGLPGLRDTLWALDEAVRPRRRMLFK